MIDFNKVNFEQFFGWVNASNTKLLKSSAFRGTRSFYTELAFFKYSDNQLKHVGLEENGRDFVIKKTNELIEMKSLFGMFKKDGDCNPITLKNSHPNTKQKKVRWTKKSIIKTFDYIFLVDTKKMSMAYSTWDCVYNRLDESCNEPKVVLKKSDYTMIV
jgi:hypothetical protein